MKNKTTAIAVVDNRTIHEITIEINTSYHKTKDAVAAAHEHNADAIKFALQCGNALNAAKIKLPHGEFGKHLKDNCKAVKESYARRLMDMANRYHGTDLKDCKTVRQVLLALGIINDPKPKKEIAAQKLPIPATVTDIEAERVPDHKPPASSHVAVAPAATEPLIAGLYSSQMQKVFSVSRLMSQVYNIAFAANARDCGGKLAANR